VIHDETQAARLIARRRAIRAYGEQGCEPIMFCPRSEDDLQSESLAKDGETQERIEVAFCYGMMLGGLIAMAVLSLTLWARGVIG
jgi:hypothetical protein